MRKLRLDVEDLNVQSFVTSRRASGRGTVQGADSVVVGPAETLSQPPRCWIETGNCLGTRYDIGCDTSHCIFETRDCPIETVNGCLQTSGCITDPPGC